MLGLCTERELPVAGHLEAQSLVSVFPPLSAWSTVANKSPLAAGSIICILSDLLKMGRKKISFEASDSWEDGM